MIERQIDSPIPMPLGFVVVKRREHALRELVGDAGARSVTDTSMTVVAIRTASSG